MENRSAPCIVLMADDDPEDCMIAQAAFDSSAIDGEIRFVSDGLELIDYLRNEEPRPHLVLLDLNMPRLDGLKALLEIKSDPELRNIPVVILTTSRQEKDVTLCLDAGACDFKTKPGEIDEWAEIITSSVETHC